MDYVYDNPVGYNTETKTLRLPLGGGARLRLATWSNALRTHNGQKKQKQKQKQNKKETKQNKQTNKTYIMSLPSDL